MGFPYVWRLLNYPVDICSYEVGKQRLNALTQLVDVIYCWKACSVPCTAVVAIYVYILLHSSSIERATKQGVIAV
jgi:hypothetical protein